MNSIRIVVPVDPQKTSPNKRMHWGQLARAKQAARQAAHLSWIAAGKPRMGKPVLVTVVIRRGRSIDPDNALAACKPLIDGLFNAAFTPEDTEAWIKG